MKKIVSFALMALFCICGYAQTIDPVLFQEMERRTDVEKIKVVVIMRSQCDRQQLDRRAAQFTTRAERREFVVNELKQFAEASQYDLRHSLIEMQRGNLVSEPKVLWIANAISFEATRGAILSLADRPDIRIIGYDEERNWLPDGEESYPANPPREVTSNITQVNADQVWDLGYTGQGVVVAIIDTGVNYNHLDLADHLWDGGPEFPNHGYDVYDNDDDPMDEHGHGTHCAGTICGDGTAGSQTGMAPDANLMCVKCLNSNGSCADTHIISAIQWAVDHGCDVISMSLGGYGHSGAGKTLFRNTCVNVLTSGIIAAFAAGNEGDNLYRYPVPYNVALPGSCPPPYLDPDQEQNPGDLSCSVCVGAVDFNDQATYFSSHGPCTWSDSDYADYPYTFGSQTEFGLIRPDVCAPGVYIKSADYSSNDGYVYKSGTSMATPCVAGCIALMLSKNMDATPAEICQILEETAVPLTEGKSNIYGYGRVNVLNAINTMGVDLFEFETVTVNDWQGNNDGNLNAGETVSLDLTIRCDSIVAFDEVTLVLSTESEYVTIIDSAATLLYFDAGEIITIEDIFAFSLSEDAPPKSAIPFIVEIYANGELLGIIMFNIMVYGTVFSFDQVSVMNDNNNNGYLEPGETADLHVSISNIGNVPGTSIVGTLSTTFPYLTINEATAIFGNIEVDAQSSANFNVTLSNDVPEIFIIDLSLDLVDDSEKHSNLDFEFEEGIIVFADPVVKSICVSNWDTDNDGELSYAEAALITDLGSRFSGNSEITTFDELQYFINLTSIGNGAFYNCRGLTSIVLPNSVTTIGEYTFLFCRGLTSIVLPYSLTSIGSAFIGCYNLNAVYYTGDIHQWCNIQFNNNSSNPLFYAHNLYIDNELVTDLVIPETVTEIKPNAFYGATCLVSLTLPNSITSIGSYAFSGCRNVISITSFAEVPPTIGNQTFGSWSANTVIFVPCDSEGVYDSLSWGGFSNFYGMCGGIVTVASNPEEGGMVGGGGMFGAGEICTVTATANEGYVFTFWTQDGIRVTTNAEYTFYVLGNMNLVAHFVPEGNIAFADANVKDLCVANWDTNADGELSYVEAANVVSLGEVFLNNSSISSFDELQCFIGLTSINNSAFCNCIGLTSIVLPNFITSIGEGAFRYCDGLASIVWSNSVTSIGDCAFQGCSNLVFITSLAISPPTLDNQSFALSSSDVIVYVPCGYEDAYASISWGGFSHFYGLCGGTVTVVAIPEEGGMVTGGGTFEAEQTCTVTATTMENYAFAYWTLDGIIVSNSAEYSFYVVGDMDLVAHFVPDGNIIFADADVKAICISHWDANGDDELSYLEAASVTELGTYFLESNITSFDELQYFTGLTSIRNNAFSNCSSLTTIVLPNTITTIDSAAFYSCSSLDSIILPNSVTSIGAYAFDGCDSLDAVYYTGDIHQWCNIQFENVGSSNPLSCAHNLFIDDDLVTDLVIPETETEIKPFAFYGASCLTSLTIPNSVTSIGESAFYKCNNLADTLTIPNSVATIGHRAFSYCDGLTGISIGNSVTTIGNAAFYYCTGLESMTVLAETPPTLYQDAFAYCPTSISVYVPCGSLEAYQNVEGWNEFANIQESYSQQTVTLSEGWSWWSTNLDITLDDLKSAIADTVGYEGTASIKSQNGALTLRNGLWRGNGIQSLDVRQMYVIQTSVAYEITLAGTPVNPSEYEITITPDNNWIGFLPNTEMTLSEAFGTFPVNGDVVKSRNNSSVYHNGQWRGQLNGLQPGHGYIYESRATGNRTFTFPSNAK